MVWLQYGTVCETVLSAGVGSVCKYEPFKSLLVCFRTFLVEIRTLTDDMNFSPWQESS